MTDFSPRELRDIEDCKRRAAKRLAKQKKERAAMLKKKRGNSDKRLHPETFKKRREAMRDNGTHKRMKCNKQTKTEGIAVDVVHNYKRIMFNLDELPDETQYILKLVIYELECGNLPSRETLIEAYMITEHMLWQMGFSDATRRVGEYFDDDDETFEADPDIFEDD